MNAGCRLHRLLLIQTIAGAVLGGTLDWTAPDVARFVDHHLFAVKAEVVRLITGGAPRSTILISSTER